MRDLARATIREAAQKAGLDPARVYELVEADNLTIERPYMTVQFLPESYKRTGRKLDVTRTSTEVIRSSAVDIRKPAKPANGYAPYGAQVCRKRELYEVELLAAANILAEDEKWLADFCYAFVAALPRGLNDERGNWVKIRAEKAQFAKPPDKRVGDEVIEVFRKCGQLHQLSFTGRIVEITREPLIETHTLDIHWKGAR